METERAQGREGNAAEYCACRRERALIGDREKELQVLRELPQLIGSLPNQVNRTDELANRISKRSRKRRTGKQELKS